MALGTASTWPLSIYKGEDVVHSFEVEDSLTSDITGWTFVLTIKDDDDNPTFTTTVNGTVIDGPNRLFNVVMPAATTELIVVGVHKHDIWRTNFGYHWVFNDATYTVKTERRVQTP